MNPLQRDVYAQLAHDDFEHAMRKGRQRRLMKRLTKKSTRLQSFAAIRNQFHGMRTLGLQTINMRCITGSVGRESDFDAEFNPRAPHVRHRWVEIDIAYYTDVHLPPVELYKVGDHYYVIDGHHRISVLRRHGQRFIDAYVTEIESSTYSAC
jgi:hypothetical protein